MSKLLKIIVGVVVIAVMIFLLFWVFPGKVILAPSFSVGFVTIHYYGLVIGLAILCSWWLLAKNLPKVNLTKAQLENLFIVLLISGFLGARIFHVFTDWEYYSQNFSEIFYVWHGGLAIFGAVIGALIGLAIYNRKFLHQNFWSLVDWLIPGVVLGQVIGRFGNLFNYELYGLPTDLPWKMFVPQTSQKSLFEVAQFYFHPLFLYESLAGLLILLVLIRYNDLSKKFGLVNSPGILFCIWLILYGITRLFIEQLRIQHSYIGDFSVNFIIGAGMVIVGLVFYIKKYYESKSA